MNISDPDLLAAALNSTAAVAWRWEADDPERFLATLDGDAAACGPDLRSGFSDADWHLLLSRLTASVDEGRRFQCSVNIEAVDGDELELHVLGGAESLDGAATGRCCGLCWLGGASLHDSNQGTWAPLAKLSHELRSPLAGIAQQTLELRNDTDNKAVRATLDLVHENARFALRVIEDMLDAFRSGEPETRGESTRVDTRRLLAQLVPVVRDRARRKGLALSVVDDEDFPRVFWADAVALRRILQNLLDNAVKFTRSGSITLTLSRREERGANLLSFEVEDSGPGMTAEDAQWVFEPFQKGRAGRRSSTGLGIGLALSRQLATGLGGELNLVGSAGEGCRFRLSIPAHEADASGAADNTVIELPYVPQARSVLLVEDHELLTNVTRRALTRLGCTVEVAATAREALALIERWTPEVVILDLDLPDMSGCELCERLMQRDQLADCRFVAYSGSDDLMDRAAAEQAGFHAFIMKPASAEELLADSAQTIKRKAR